MHFIVWMKIVSYHREHTIFVPTGLVYFTEHNAFQLGILVADGGTSLFIMMAWHEFEKYQPNI